MSKMVTYSIKLEDVNPEFMDEAVRRMADDLKLSFKIKKNHRYKYKGATYYIKNGCLMVRCDDMCKSRYEPLLQRMKQFYGAVELSNAFNTDFEYDTNEEKIELMIPV